MLHIIYGEFLNSDPDLESGSRETFPDPDLAKRCGSNRIQIRNTEIGNAQDAYLIHKLILA
jgi:hypothetical protein